MAEGTPASEALPPSFAPIMELMVAEAMKPAEARLWFAKSTHVIFRASFERSVMIHPFGLLIIRSMRVKFGKRKTHGLCHCTRLQLPCARAGCTFESRL